jgi:hypothetical protein
MPDPKTISAGAIAVISQINPLLGAAFSIIGVIRQIRTEAEARGVTDLPSDAELIDQFRIEAQGVQEDAQALKDWAAGLPRS